MNRFEKFKQEFINMTLEELALYIGNNFSQEEICSCCTGVECNQENSCKQGVINYLEEEEEI